MKQPKPEWTEEFETELDNEFITRVANEVQQSCALPMAVPTERLPQLVINAAQWFYEYVDQSMEQRNFVILNRDIVRCNAMNKLVQLPSQIFSVFGCFKVQDHLKYSTTGDFSVERMLMSSYSMFGGAGIIGGGLGLTGGTGYTLTDVTMALWEVDQFDQYLNPPITFSFNSFSHKLNIIGNLEHSDLLIQTFTRCRIQDLYNSYHFFRLVVCFCKQALAQIYGAFSYKLPGGVEINYDMFKSDAEDEIQKIEEWAENNRASSFFFVPNQI